MSRPHRRGSGVVASLLLALLVGADAGAGERIRAFDTGIEIASDGSFVVEERIRYDFGDARKRGIFRDVPVAYGRGHAADYRIALDVLDVRDGSGEAVPYRLSREGRDRRIRIGDPDRRVTGEHSYRIRYRVRRGILWLEAHDELYWNATGNGWSVPIDRATATVATPADRDAGPSRALCFTGPRGSVATDCAAEIAGRAVRVASTAPLGAGEGLTLVVALPKGLLDEPSALRRTLDRASDWVSLATVLPLLVLAGMGAHWWRNGRDPAGAAADPVRYEPPERMTPAEMGVVHDEQVDTLDVTATLLDLAVRGHVRIEEIEAKRFLFLSETDYLLHRLGRDDEGLKPFERQLLTALFGSADRVKLSSLKNAFYRELPAIRDALYESVSRDGRWFPTRPDHVRTRYAVIGLGVTIPLAALGMISGRPSIAVAMTACAVIVGLFSRAMPRRTRDGRRALQHIRGFREFVLRVEKDRLERMGMRNLAQFERLLPYAFVLGVADAWADAFADLYTQPPAWFEGHDGGAFRPGRLVDRVGRALDTAGTTMTSQPGGGSGSSGFGGGGSSGGGFGGGGGGSW